QVLWTRSKKQSTKTRSRKLKPQILQPDTVMPLPIEAPQVWEDLVSIADIGPEGLHTILKLTTSIKARPADFRGTLAGKQIALFIERFGDARKTRLAYVGDGNNVAHSLLLTAASLGGAITVATPAGYEPQASIFERACEIAAETGAVLKLTHDADIAVEGADAVYTDVWASMGQESEHDERQAVFAPFQVNKRLFARAARHAVFMHCLPAHRGDEVTDAVIDSSRSVVFDQAENRLHVQKAILLILLGGGARSF